MGVGMIARRSIAAAAVAMAFLLVFAVQAMADDNTKTYTLQADEPAYAILYENGDFVMQRGDAENPARGAVVGKWTGFEDNIYHYTGYYSGTDSPWYSQSYMIKEVVVAPDIKPVSTSYWFYDCSNLVSVDLSGLDTSSVTDMGGMFRGCSNLVSVDLSGLDTSSVTSMEDMFGACSNLISVDLSGLDTSSVTNMQYMFDGCSKLKTVDLSSFDTSKVTYMYAMFRECYLLSSLDLSSFEIGLHTNMESMFDECRSLQSLTTGEGWMTVLVSSGYQACFPVAMYRVDDSSNQMYRAGSVIPSGAATYSTNQTKAITPTITLSAASYTYDGKVKKPTVTVRDGSTVLAASNYSVLYAPGCTNAGTYWVTVVCKNNYSGVNTALFKINPKKITPTVALSATAYTYDGKVKKPTVTVKNGSTKLGASAYTVTYASGRKNVGSYKVTVTLKGNYSGSKALAFKINPKGTSLKTLSGASGAIAAKWAKQAGKMSTSYIGGYQVQVATNSGFTANKKTVTVAGYGKVSTKVSKLKRNTKYFVHVRTYKKVGSTTYYSPWSAARTVKTK